MLAGTGHFSLALLPQDASCRCFKFISLLVLKKGYVVFLELSPCGEGSFPDSLSRTSKAVYSHSHLLLRLKFPADLGFEWECLLEGTFFGVV